MTRAEPNRIDDDAVAEFLVNNNDFFNRRPELLPELAMPPPAKSGAVVSLADRQAAILRDRNQQMHQRLAALIEVAKENDRTFAGMRTLALALMDANTQADLSEALTRHFVAGFGADHVVCLVANAAESLDENAAALRHVDPAELDEPLRRAFELTAPACDAYRPNDYAAIFPGADLEGPGSVAIVPLAREQSTFEAVLAVGAVDPNRFTPEMGGVFLSFAGEVLARTLKRIFG